MNDSRTPQSDPENTSKPPIRPDALTMFIAMFGSMALVSSMWIYGAGLPPKGAIQFILPYGVMWIYGQFFAKTTASRWTAIILAFATVSIHPWAFGDYVGTFPYCRCASALQVPLFASYCSALGMLASTIPPQRNKKPNPSGSDNTAPAIETRAPPQFGGNQGERRHD